MQGHASQRQDEVPPPFRRQTFPKNRGSRLNSSIARPKPTCQRAQRLDSNSRRFLELCQIISGILYGVSKIRLHWVLDVTFGEDASRTRIKPTHFARFRSFAINILRANGVENVARELYINALNFDNALSYRVT